MKKTAIITLMAVLLAAAILACGNVGATNATNASSAAAAGAMDAPTELFSKAITWIEAATEENSASSAAATTAQTSEESSEAPADVPDTAQPEPLPVVAAAQAPPPVIAVQSASPTPATDIAPVVPTPATAAQTTTTTSNVSPQTVTATTATLPASNTAVLYTKGNYEWLGTTQAVTTATTTTTAQYVLPVTTTTQPPTMTTTTSPTTVTQAGPDYEAMGQAAYQDEAIRALNALRAEYGLPPMTVSVTLMATSLAQAQRMVVAGREYHSTVDLPGCESVARIPYNFPAKLLGETLGKHTPQFLTDSRSTVGIAIIRQGNNLYAVMQGS